MSNEAAYPDPAEKKTGCASEEYGRHDSSLRPEQFTRDEIQPAHGTDADRGALVGAGQIGVRRKCETRDTHGNHHGAPQRFRQHRLPSLNAATTERQK
jgi:hypothetical protein